MRDVPKGVEFVEGLLGWIHERPEMYCRLAGELDAVMHFLHLAWAEVKDRTADLHAALAEAGVTPCGLLSDEERTRPVQRDDEVTRRVLAFWARVDEILGVTRYPVIPSSSQPE
jgi:hypothetical protein